MRWSHSAFPIKGRRWWLGIGTPASLWPVHRLAVPEICQAVRQKGLEEFIRAKTGLQVDPLFPSSKIQWLFENRPEIRKLAEEGRACLGTVDAWLVWNLTGHKRFVTDYSNASRTQLFNIGRVSGMRSCSRFLGCRHLRCRRWWHQTTPWATRYFLGAIQSLSAAF